MGTAEAVQAYQTISEHTQSAAEFKEKARKLLEEAAQEALSAAAHSWRPSLGSPSDRLVGAAALGSLL